MSTSEKQKKPSKLKFEDTDKKKILSKLTHTPDLAAGAVRSSARSNIKEGDKDNSGNDAAVSAESMAEGGLKALSSASEKLKEHRSTRARENNTEGNGGNKNKNKANQKKKIKKEYSKSGTAAKNAKRTKKNAENSKKAGQFVARHKGAFIVIGLIIAALMMFMGLASSCSFIAQGGSSAVGSATYAAEEEDLLDAENSYLAKEAELKAYLDSYEASHSYDEYRYDLDEIGHDPYVLISALSALQNGDWSDTAAAYAIDLLFSKQYKLTENVRREIREREVTKTETYYVTNPDTGELEAKSREVTVKEQYVYSICTVTLENLDLSHIPVTVMTEAQLGLYATQMSSLGGNPELFPSSPYVALYSGGSTSTFTPSSASLSSPRFAAMMKEGQKYIGYPYIWGGCSPTTSFDGPGFVSWVINQSGVNVGTLSVSGLKNICFNVSASNAKPGDLVFFNWTEGDKTMSHVGICAGNGMMLHCGDPIQFEPIANWQSRLDSYGRLP